MVLAHNIQDGDRTRDIKINQDVTFDSMLLSSSTLDGLKQAGFFKPSPVQLHGIPLGKCGFDLLLEAKSGTGKTAVFTIIALEKLDLSKGLQVVILAPTREIAAQICDVIQQIGCKFEGLAVEVVMGGLPVFEDINKFKKNVHVVVGSPGRLRHLIQEKHINVSSVRLLIFDEADKLMEKSFQPDINFIFSILPNQKQIILSSATYTDITKSFISKYVKSAQHICPDSDCILLGIEQKTTTVKFNVNIVRQTQYKFEELLKILSHKVFKQCLIFCNYQARVTELHKMLTKKNWPSMHLYGQQEQTDRLDALRTLQDYKCRILISTDLAARGIDASNVDLVINFETPFEWQTYLHRIGRAGRYGSYGMAITILSKGKEEREFENMLQSINAPVNVTSYWTNESLNSIVDTQLKLPILLDTNNIMNGASEKYEELWKEFTCNVTSDIQCVESFETLCESFEKAKLLEVESFNDLLTSFQNNKGHIIEGGNYHPIEISDKTTAILSELLRNANGSCNSSDNRNHSLKPINIIENCISKKMGCSMYNHLKMNNIKGTEEIIKDQPELEKKDIQHTYLNSADPEIMSSHKVQFEAADLSLSFGTKKNVVVNNTIHLNSQANKLKNNQSIQRNHSCESRLPKSNISKTSHNNNSSTKTNNINENYKYSSYKNNTDNQKHMRSCYLSESYTNWYNQLKHRMKQLEIAYYIEEMTQLYHK